MKRTFSLCFCYLLFSLHYPFRFLCLNSYYPSRSSSKFNSSTEPFLNSFFGNNLSVPSLPIAPDLYFCMALFLFILHWDDLRTIPYHPYYLPRSLVYSTLRSFTSSLIGYMPVVEYVNVKPSVYLLGEETK